MKKLLIVFIILPFCGLSQQKYGWMPTGRTQVWKATIYKNSMSKVGQYYQRDKVTGYAKFKEMKYVPDPASKYPGWNDPKQNVWNRAGDVYDANNKVIDIESVSHVEFTQPKTEKLKKG